MATTFNTTQITITVNTSSKNWYAALSAALQKVVSNNINKTRLKLTTTITYKLASGSRRIQFNIGGTACGTLFPGNDGTSTFTSGWVTPVNTTSVTITTQNVNSLTVSSMTIGLYFEGLSWPTAGDKIISTDLTKLGIIISSSSGVLMKGTSFSYTNRFGSVSSVTSVKNYLCAISSLSNLKTLVGT